VLGAALGALLSVSRAPLPAQAREVVVGSYLPPAPSNPGFVFFRATPKDTPPSVLVTSRFLPCLLSAPAFADLQFVD